MNTKGIKFLAVLAVLAMAFAVFAAIAPAETDDADIPTTSTNVATAEEFVEAVEAGDYNIKLTADITLGSDKLTLGAGIINMNGKTLTLGADTENGGIVTIKGVGTIDLNGKTLTNKVASGIQIGTYTAKSGSDWTNEKAFDKTTTITLIDSATTKGKITMEGSGATTLIGGTLVMDGSAADLASEYTLNSIGLHGGKVVFKNSATLSGVKPATGMDDSIIQIGGSAPSHGVYIPNVANGELTFQFQYGIDLYSAKWTIVMTIDGKVSVGGIVNADIVTSTYYNKLIVNKDAEATISGTVSTSQPLVNNGAIIVSAEKSLKFVPAGTAADDLRNIGLQGSGSVSVKGTLQVLEGKAQGNAYVKTGLFAIGSNTVTVSYGGTLNSVQAASPVTYSGIIGSAAADGTKKVDAQTDVPSQQRIGLSAGASVEIAGTFTKGSTAAADTFCQTYTLNGNITLGNPKNTSDTGYLGFKYFVGDDKVVIKSGNVVAKGTFETGNVDTQTTTTVTIESGASFKSSDQFFILGAGNALYLKGTLDITPDGGFVLYGSDATKAQVVLSGGEFYLEMADPTHKTKDDIPAGVVYQSGKIYAQSNSRTDRTDITPTEEEPVVVNNEDALINAIEEGASEITVTGNFATSEDLKVPEGTDITIDSTATFTISNKKVLEMNGGTLNGPITFNNGSGDVTIVANDLKGNFTMTPGSVIVNGVITSGGIDVTAGGVYYITGSLNGEFTIRGASTTTPTTDNKATVIFKDFTVNANGKLILENLYKTTETAGSVITYQVGENNKEKLGYFYLYGTIIPYQRAAADVITNYRTIDSVTITVGKADDSNKNTFMAFAGAQLSGKVEVSGDGNIDLSQAQNVQKIDQDISADKTYGQLEAVEVIGSLSIKNNSTVTIKGTLTINEGVTLSIENGSKLIISDGVATVTIDGKMTVENGAVFKVVKAKAVDITGELVSSGKVDIAATGETTVKSGGSILIRDDSNSQFIVAGGLTVAKGGEVTVRGQMDASPINNKGTVTLNGAILTNSSTISMIGSGAVLNVLAVQNNGTDHNLVINDNGLKFATGKVVGYGDYASYKNTITIGFGATEDIFKGLTVTETVVSYELSGVTYYYNYMDLDGSMVYTDKDSVPAAKTITVDGPYTEVNDKLTIGAGVNMQTVQKLAVKGDIEAIAVYSTDKKATVSGAAGSKITVTGEIVTRQAIADAANVVNAAYYTTELDTVTYHVYTTLVDAVGIGATDIKTFGDVSVGANLEIPAGVSITNSGTIKVGSSDNTSVVVLVKDGATVKGSGIIDVYGSITFENKKDCKNTVKSDVTVENGDSVTYTSVYLAITQSQLGDVITITREGTTKLSTSLTIPEGRTLNVPASKVLQLAPGVTLTVNGVLQTAEKVTVDTTTYSDAKFDTVATLVGKHTAAIKVNGMFKSMAELTYANYKTAGAYYNFADSTGNYNYVSPVEIAVLTDAKSLTVYGTVISGAVEWAGTSSSAKTFNVADGAEYTALSLDFDYVNFNATGEFSGYLSYGDATVLASEVTGLVAKNKDGTDVAFYLDTVTISATNEDASFSITAGDVYAKEIKGDATIATEATLLVAKSATALSITGDLVVLGGFEIDNARVATVGGDTYIAGYIAVTPASEDGTKAAGTLTMKEVYLGIEEEDIFFLADGASLTGPVTFDILYAAAGTTVPDEILEDLTMKSTTFFVEDAVYITAYTKASTYYISAVDFELEIADFKGWYNADDESALLNLAKIGQTGWTEVYADIDYNVYSLVVKTDDGVKSVAVDGKELINLGNNVFISDYTDKLGFKLTAGKYTISFTLKDGYEGTPILYDAEGKAVIGGYGITIAGDSDHRTVTYQLSGTEPIPEPEPTPTPEPEKESEWNVTTILLLVLVILIAIMAVIVALRLNRN